jgi:hypothetical protein
MALHFFSLLDRAHINEIIGRLTKALVPPPPPPLGSSCSSSRSRSCSRGCTRGCSHSRGSPPPQLQP